MPFLSITKMTVLSAFLINSCGIGLLVRTTVFYKGWYAGMSSLSDPRLDKATFLSMAMAVSAFTFSLFALMASATNNILLLYVYIAVMVAGTAIMMAVGMTRWVGYKHSSQGGIGVILITILHDITQEELDFVQRQFRCCGIERYTDYFMIWTIWGQNYTVLHGYTKPTVNRVPPFTPFSFPLVPHPTIFSETAEVQKTKSQLRHMVKRQLKFQVLPKETRKKIEARVWRSRKLQRNVTAPKLDQAEIMKQLMPWPVERLSQFFDEPKRESREASDEDEKVGKKKHERSDELADTETTTCIEHTTRTTTKDDCATSLAPALEEVFVPEFVWQRWDVSPPPYLSRLPEHTALLPRGSLQNEYLKVANAFVSAMWKSLQDPLHFVCVKIFPSTCPEYARYMPLIFRNWWSSFLGLVQVWTDFHVHPARVPIRWWWNSGWDLVFFSLLSPRGKPVLPFTCCKNPSMACYGRNEYTWTDGCATKVVWYWTYAHIQFRNILFCYFLAVLLNLGIVFLNIRILRTEE